MTTSTAKQPRIRVLTGYTKVVNSELLAQAVAAHTGFTANVKLFTTPPVSMTDFETLIDSFSTSIGAAKDGGKQAVSLMNEQREAVIDVLLQLAPYAVAVSKGLMSVFTLSGFAAASTTRKPRQPLSSSPVVRKINQGISGQLLVIISALLKAISYEVRYAPVVNGTPAAWIIVTATKAQSAVAFNNLTPGTTYAFQVRALGKAGYTDWSDSVTRMCI